MKRKVDIAVSTDPIKDLQSIIDYAKELQGVADLLHCDVMDGKFVGKKTYDETVVKAINSQSLLPLDVHLMCQEPSEKICEYVKAGANIVTVHYEAFKDKNKLIDTLKEIRQCGALAGLSFKPGTEVKDVKSYFFYVDIVLVMSVEPGKSGQSFMESTYARLSEINKFRKDNKLCFKIEIDGGVNDKNAELLTELGADILVSGSFVCNATDLEKAIKKLQKN